MGQPVMHFEIMGKDADKLQSFYSGVFDWKIGGDFGGEGMTYRTVESEGEGIGGGIGAADGMDGHVTFYVGVDDVEAALQKVESLGGTRVMGPEKMDNPPLELGMFADPEGHTIGLVHPLDR